MLSDTGEILNPANQVCNGKRNKQLAVLGEQLLLVGRAAHFPQYCGMAERSGLAYWLAEKPAACSASVAQSDPVFAN